MNWKLKLALMKQGKPAYWIAQAVGISESRLSRLVRGRVIPTPEERKLLAEILGLPEVELFVGEATR